MFDEKDLQYLQEMEKRVLEQSAANMRTILESAVQPQFNLLAENQQAILEKVAPKSRVEELEDKVDFLESIVRRISKDLDELKKAQ